MMPAMVMATNGRHTMVSLKIDPLTLLSLAAFLAAAVYLLGEIMELFMLRRRRRKRSQDLSQMQCPAFMLQGKESNSIYSNKI